MSSFRGGNEPGSGSSGLAATTNKKKPSWTRRSWSLKEEECLLAALKEIVANGWKSDNSFKAGYHKILEDALKLKLPGTDLNKTHIHSKITIWKKNYGSLQAILSRSGVGFSPRGDYMIECEDEQWEQIIKVDSNAKSMRYKPWPYYEAWAEVFGTDRATGETAEDMFDAANDLNADEDAHMGSFEHDTDPTTEDMNHDADNGDSVSQAAKHYNSKAKGKRRSSGSDLDAVCEVLHSIGNKADARLSEMVKRVGFDFEVKATKKEAFRLLDFIPGLTVKQKFYVCQILAKELDKLDVFMGLYNEERPSYVLFLLEEAGKL